MSMDTGQTKRRWSLWPAGVLVLVLVFLLTACGSRTTTGSSAGSGATPSPTQSPASGNGCPGNVLTTRLAPAGVVLTDKNNGSTIKVSRGEIIEVDLPFGHVWSGPVNFLPGLLTMQTPAGYASPALGACVWRFTPTGTGTVRLSFVGQPLCGKGQVCPMYVLAILFTLDIS